MAMQMIYSAGTTSHSPRCSPVPPRKYPSPRPSPRASPREWRPVMPGYKPPAGHALVPYSRSPEVEHNPIIVTEDDINLKDFIPAMPRSIAITCLVCNILFPGFGTFLSGTTVFCCAKVRPKGASKMTVLKRNSWVAMLQFITAFILLLGWIWSIMWGTSFLRISKESGYLDETEEGADSNHNSTSDDSSAVSHRRSIASLTSPTTSTTPTANTATTSRTNQLVEQAPIIVLQEAPVAVHTNRQEDPSQQARQTGSGRPLNPLNPRHNRILRHQCDPQLPSLFLSPQTLENIVMNGVSPPELLATGSSEPEPLWKG